MIKATELRIGNYIYFNPNGKPFVKVVKELRGNDLICSGIDQPEQRLALFYTNGDIEPIPLTREWLERCGLERLPLGKYMIDGNWHLRIGDCIIAYDDRPSFVEGNFSYMGFRIPKQILYLHQLQNLYFALTGKELTIKESA